DVVDKLETMTEWFKPMNVEPLSVTLTDRYAWRARLSNGTVIELGRELNDDDRTALAAGDLVFCGRKGRVDHAGIYVGDRRLLHAPGPGRADRVGPHR
ncbi:cell division protein FtsQ/DivIB, partial [Mycobacterium tuberculosis]|nr:cell division protein FtsQ/DivIB [Mycobacterium tuberculosis]